MNKIFTLVLIFFSVSLFSQTTDSTKIDFQQIEQAGINLERHHYIATSGLGMQLIGMAVMAGGNMVSKPESKKVIITSGAVIGAVGVIVLLSSYKHLRKASYNLKKITPSSEGVGIAFKL